jgi:hypothetical protein
VKIAVLQATGVDARSLNPKAARILSEAKAATWEVHRLWEILLPTTTRVPSYYENPVTQKKSSHACLIIEILSWIQNSSFIDLRAIDVWGRRIARCGEIRKQRRWRCTVWSVPLLQEVIKYVIKQYLYKIGKIAYLIFTCVIEMMYCIHSSWRHNVSSVWWSRVWWDRLDEELEVECRCRA